MKDFIFNTAMGRRFESEILSLAKNKGLVINHDIYEDYFVIIFEQYLELQRNDLISFIVLSEKYDLDLSMRAEYDSLIFEYRKL